MLKLFNADSVADIMELAELSGWPLWLWCPLYPQKRTCAAQKRMSALGQKRTRRPA